MRKSEKANWFETYVTGNQNPAFKTLNTGYGSPSFVDFHDALSLPGLANQISIAPAYAISQCAAMPNVCAIFPDLFINVATYGKVDTNFDVYKNTDSNK